MRPGQRPGTVARSIAPLDHEGLTRLRTWIAEHEGYSLTVGATSVVVRTPYEDRRYGSPWLALDDAESGAL